MGPASTLALASAVVVLYVAGFHGWIYLLRRKERANLWFALAAGAIGGFGLSAAMLYQSATVAEGVFWQRAMFWTSCPLVAGFLRFSFAFLRVERRWVTAAGFGFALAAAAIASGTDWVFSGAPALRRVEALGMEWVESEMRPLGRLLMATYFVVFAYLIALYARHLRAGAPGVRTLLVTVCIWCATGLSDAAVGMGLHEAPYLLVFGYLGIVLGISSVLVRSFVRSVDELELLNETLHERVEARSEELRQKEIQLAHGERLATLGTLAASVAHEINNPIAFVHSNLNRLEELWHKPEADGEIEEILAECREGTERVRAIVSDLLALARRGDSRSEPVDLREVVASVLPVVRGPARSRARLDTELRAVPRIQGDPRLLGQVVLNLVMNALQALPPGRPDVHRVTVSTAFEDGVVRLVVADTGPGIPADQRERIFDPFFTTKSDGTGLGLAVSRQIVTRHHGVMRVECGESGTRMIVELPGR